MASLTIKRQGQISVGTRTSAEGFEIWGLTGGVASGKSTAARFFAEAGIPVIDADQISRELSSPGGTAHRAIQQRFGTDDRQKLREVVFADPAARRDLEAILHPLIQAESLRRMQEMARVNASRGGEPTPYIYEAALLVETGRYRELTGLIVVEAPREARMARLLARDGITKELAAKMIDSQISDADRRAAATVVLENDGSEADLRERVRKLVAARGWA